MNYSVYIIQDRRKTNAQLFEKLAGDTKLWEHTVNVLDGGVNDFAGGDLLDQYATTDRLGENGIAINGEMISSVSIKSELVKKEMFTEGTNRFDPLIVRTITVKGNLFAPSLIEMKSEAVHNKNMARILAWASLPQTRNETRKTGYSGDAGDESFTLSPSVQDRYSDDADSDDAYEKYYYRRVLVTVYSDKDTQFRALLYDKVYVSSYEENYSDKDGNGQFTLVMQCIAKNIYDTFVAGPTYNMWSATAIADQITSTVSQHTKTATKVVETVDRIAGTDIAETIAPYIEKIDSATETADSIKDDVTVDNISGNVDKQAETYHPTDVQDAIEQAAEYQKAYDGLTDEQKKILKNISGFDKMDIAEKMKYIEKLTGKDG